MFVFAYGRLDGFFALHVMKYPVRWLCKVFGCSAQALSVALLVVGWGLFMWGNGIAGALFWPLALFCAALWGFLFSFNVFVVRRWLRVLVDMHDRQALTLEAVFALRQLAFRRLWYLMATVLLLGSSLLWRNVGGLPIVMGAFSWSLSLYACTMLVPPRKKLREYAKAGLDRLKEMLPAPAPIPVGA